VPFPCAASGAQALKSKLTEERLSKPLPAAVSRPAQLEHNQLPRRITNGSSLVIQLEDASPPQRPQPGLFHGPPQQRPLQPQRWTQQPAAASSGRDPHSNGFQQQSVPPRSSSPAWGAADSGRPLGPSDRDLGGSWKQELRFDRRDAEPKQRTGSRQFPSTA